MARYVKADIDEIINRVEGYKVGIAIGTNNNDRIMAAVSVITDDIINYLNSCEEVDDEQEEKEEETAKED